MHIQYNDDENVCLVCNWDFFHDIEVEKRKGLQELLIKTDECHHYTTLEGFWKILESETFRATHVRFSNDNQEYYQGEEIIKSIVGPDNVKVENYYVICFCSDGNLLSQWREYGKVGVSIKMDFSRHSVFTLLNNIPNDPKTSIHPGKQAYSLPIKVLYTNSDDVNQKLHVEGIKNTITVKDLMGYYKKTSFEIPKRQQMRTLIPYIKNSAFAEELESRLLFTLPIGDEKDYVFYLNTNNYQKPYFSVKYGDTKEHSVECTYVDIGKNMDSPIKVAIEAAVNQFNVVYSSTVCVNSNDDSDCIFISDGIHQKELLFGIEKEFKQISVPTPHIWCDGHWPIRSIMVGPTPDKEIIRESIEHYCKNHYWLKNVKVETTKTPYREKRIMQSSTHI